MVEFDSELDKFWKSVEDGTIFDDISPELWEIAQRIAENNKEVMDGF